MPRSERRQNLPLQCPLQRKLSLYALAAGAAGAELLALKASAKAEVVYTSVHTIVGRNQIYAIDLNHDGFTDFLLINVFRTGSSPSYKTARLELSGSSYVAVVYKMLPPT